MERLRDVNSTYRRFEIERRALMMTATEFGIPVRQIAKQIDESASLVAFRIKRARETGTARTNDLSADDEVLD